MENGRSENDEMSRRVWEAVETSTGEVGVGEAKRRSKRRGQEKERRKEEEENEKMEDNGGEKSSRGMGDMGGRRRSSKVKSGGKEVGTRKGP